MVELTSHGRGLHGEQVAKDYYEFRGYTIVALREFNRVGRQMGEIDCIAVKGTHIHFIEVKTRAASGRALEFGLEAVDAFKQRKLLAAVKRYMQSHRNYKDFQLHIDVCVVELQLDNEPKSVTIISDAVEDVYG